MWNTTLSGLHSSNAPIRGTLRVLRDGPEMSQLVAAMNQTCEYKILNKPRGWKLIRDNFFVAVIPETQFMFTLLEYF